MTVHESTVETEHLLKRANLMLRGRCDALLADSGVTLPQVDVLGQLWSGQASCLRDLGDQLGTQPATLKGILDGLEKRGLMVRTVDSSDGRIKRLDVTEAGTDLQEQVTTVRETVQSRAFQGFSDEEVQTLNGWLARIVRNLGEGELATPLWGDD